MGRLLDLATDREMQASDLTSIMSLVEYSGKNAGPADVERVASLLAQLIERYPNRSDFRIQQYLLLSSRGEKSPAELDAILSEAQKANPGDLEVYPYRILQNRSGYQSQSSYVLAVRWMEREFGRR